MKQKLRFFTWFLLFLLFLNNPGVQSTPTVFYQHKIAGYGPVMGEYVFPKAIQFNQSKIYIQDQFGVSIIDQATRHLEKRFPVEQGSEENSHYWDKQSSWIHLIRNFSLGISQSMDPSNKNLLSIPGLGNVSLLAPAIGFDSQQNLYLAGINNVLVYHPNTGELLNKIQLPPLEAALLDPETPTSFSFKIYEDKIFLLERKTNLDPTSINATVKIYLLTLSGVIEKEISIEPNPESTLNIETSDFVYYKSQELIGFPVSDRQDHLRCPIQFFNLEGHEVVTKGNFGQMLPLNLEMQEPGRLIISGLIMSGGGMPSLNCSIQVANLMNNPDGSIDILKDRLVSSPKLGMFAFDMAVDSSDIAVITSGPVETMLDFRVYHIVGDEIQRLGSFANKEGQIIGSIASTVDHSGNLYETSIGNNMINQYDKSGKFISQIPMDLKEISYLMGLISIFPTVTALDCKGDDLFCANLYPSTISHYSFSKKTWQKIYEDSYSNPLWLSMQFVDNTLFLLDSSTLNENAPNVSYMVEDNSLLPVNLAYSPEIDENNPPLFIDMVINDKEMLFLDTVNQEIWVYNRIDENFKEKIKIKGALDSFYSSFDEYSDGTLLLSDTVHHRLAHYSRKGDLLESIGSKGVISTGTSQEEYETNRNNFYRPISVQINNDVIYVSDFMNCRYHIITKEDRPELIWNMEELMVEDFSIFEQKQVSIPFETASSRDFSFILSTNSPFIKIDREKGMVSEKKITFTLVGDKMQPWTTQKGSVKVVFPDYPVLNIEIPVTIKTIGKIVKLTIGSEKAIINGQETDMGKGAAPLIKKGRTFVGIRFLGETIFNAKVDYEAKTKTVVFVLGNKKIELYIDQPYALINGTKVKLDAPPFIQSGRTLVPLRFISENLEATVDYEAKTQMITISYPKK